MKNEAPTPTAPLVDMAVDALMTSDWAGRSDVLPADVSGFYAASGVDFVLEPASERRHWSVPAVVRLLQEDPEGSEVEVHVFSVNMTVLASMTVRMRHGHAAAIDAFVKEALKS